MNKTCRHSLRAACTFAIVSSFGSLASAQDAQAAGTNVATPPPTQTPGALDFQDPTVGVASSPQTTAVAGASSEPVIDASSKRSTFPNKPLLATGLVVLGSSYGAAAIVGAISDRTADDKLFYPVVGPWLDLNHRGCAADPCSNRNLDRVLLVGDGVLQGIGALSVLLSIVVPETTTRNWYLIGNENVVVAPGFGTHLAGLSAAGRF